jgi:enoyl-CoA hydratase/carnithine racemase
MFNRPAALNAMTVVMEAELQRAWLELDGNGDVRVIVITGVGRAFQTGVDVKQVAAAGGMAAHQENKTHRKEGAPRGFTNKSMGVEKPVVCAVNGICAAAS